MALRMIDHGTKEYQQMVHLRNEILRKPIGLILDKAELEQEKDDILMGAFEDDRLLVAACCHGWTKIQSAFARWPFRAVCRVRE